MPPSGSATCAMNARVAGQLAVRRARLVQHLERVERRPLPDRIADAPVQLARADAMLAGDRAHACTRAPECHDPGAHKRIELRPASPNSSQQRAGSVLAVGSLSDRFGRKGMLLAGLSVFGLASLAGGLSDSAGALIAARSVMGVGAAMVSPRCCR
jgi:hypothetical protein